MRDRFTDAEWKLLVSESESTNSTCKLSRSGELEDTPQPTPAPCSMRTTAVAASKTPASTYLVKTTMTPVATTLITTTSKLITKLCIVVDCRL